MHRGTARHCPLPSSCQSKANPYDLYLVVYEIPQFKILRNNKEIVNQFKFLLVWWSIKNWRSKDDDDDVVSVGPPDETIYK